MRATAWVRRAWPYLLVGWLYSATSPYHRGLNNPNEMVRVYMSVAAVDYGHLHIDPVVARWGMVDDKARRDGVLYSSKAPLQSLVGIPVYLVAKPLLPALGLPLDARHVTHVLRALGTVVFGLAFSLFLLAWCERRALANGAPRAEGTALGLALALGTMHYPYAITFTGHALAAATAGGTFLAVVQLLRARTPRSFRGWALLTGLLAGAAPFAEYPAALVALPALLAAVALVPSLQGRLELLAALAVGGLPPFALGLWAHHTMWGSPLRTGYGFLENTSYVEVHGRGFFGVVLPTWEAFSGTLVSPGTGLFFFSPFLALGLVGLIRDALALRPRQREDATGPLSLEADRGASERRVLRGLALAALTGLALELVFISGHRGWRGGWTLGPRYIIPVVTLLGYGCAEALTIGALRPWVRALGAASIVLTGPAAALYPHLSDLYTNPLRAFVLPSYLRGETTYGVGHALGFEGHVANLFHLLPLAAAATFVGLGGRGDRGRAWRFFPTLVVGAVVTALVVGIPEPSPRRAERENRRVWGFWEPPNSALASSSGASQRVGALATARNQWERITVVRTSSEGSLRTCAPEVGGCRYGDDGWQRFGPDTLELDGQSEPLLFMHPVAGERVEASVPVPARARRAVLWFGLSDASVDSDNPHPVEVEVRQGASVLGRAEAGPEVYGRQRLELSLTSTLTPVTVGIEVERDGARVFGWDLDFLGPP